MAFGLVTELRNAVVNDALVKCGVLVHGKYCGRGKLGPTNTQRNKLIVMNPVIQSFPPIANVGATRLILGSMPGAASLAAGQYYAHPQNAFWRIMGELLGFVPDAPYATRTQALQRAGIAVWDVLQYCQRPGSLDSAIVRASEVANDFAAFFREHRAVTQVFFNGGAAEACFKRHCFELTGARFLRFQRLPSTSPAHASLRFDAKLAVWRAALGVDEADNMGCLSP